MYKKTPVGIPRPTYINWHLDYGTYIIYNFNPELRVRKDQYIRILYMYIV